MAADMDNLFQFVNNTLNLLVVDNDLESISLIRDLFSSVPVYSVHTAGNTADAVAKFRSGIKINICIMELGLDDVDNDEYYLMHHFANHFPIIVYTNSVSPAAGANCIRAGARSVVDKRTDLDKEKFVEKVNYFTLLNVINPHYNEAGTETLDFATRILFEKQPNTVTHWAEILKITDRQLRSIWHKATVRNARQVITFYRLFTYVFKYYQIQNFGTPETMRIFKNSDENKKQLYNSEIYKKCVSLMLTK